MRTSHRLTAALAGAALLVGATAFPAMAAPKPDDTSSVSAPTPSFPYSLVTQPSTVVPTFKLPGCSGLLSPGATSLFGASLSGVSPTGPGTRSTTIAAIVTSNHGTVCRWRVGTTKNYIQFSVTPISEAQRTVILADWMTRFGTSGTGVGGRNLVLTSGSISRTESAMLLEDGLYITATPVNGTMFPAFLQLEGDHLYGLIH